MLVWVVKGWAGNTSGLGVTVDCQRWVLVNEVVLSSDVILVRIWWRDDTS